MRGSALQWKRLRAVRPSASAPLERRYTACYAYKDLPLCGWLSNAAPDDQLWFFGRFRCPTTIPYVTLTGRPTSVPELFLPYTFSSTFNISFCHVDENFFLHRGPISSPPSKYSQPSRHPRWRLVDSHSQFRGFAFNVVQTRIRATAKLSDLLLALALLFSSPYAHEYPSDRTLETDSDVLDYLLARLALLWMLRDRKGQEVSRTILFFI